MAMLADLLLPVRCAGCEEHGNTLCPGCAATLDGPFEVHRPATAAGPPIYALAAYQTTPRTLVLAYKERGRRDLASPLGQILARVLPWLPGARPAQDGTWWLVPAPSKAVAASRRGGSHMLRLARACAAELSRDGPAVAVAPALRMRASAGDSVGLDGPRRAANLAGRVWPYSAAVPPMGTPVVLLDDVVTSGATAAACVCALAAVGVEVTAVLTLTATAVGTRRRAESLP